VKSKRKKAVKPEARYKRVMRLGRVGSSHARDLIAKGVVTGDEPVAELRDKMNAAREAGIAARGGHSKPVEALTIDERRERAKKLRADRLLSEAKVRRINREMVPTEDVVELHGIAVRRFLLGLQMVEERLAIPLRDYPAAMAEARAALDSIIPDTQRAWGDDLDRVKMGGEDE
jgi:hypothetical protein